MTATSWLIGSDLAVPADSFDVVATTTETKTVTAGKYYLYDATTGISLLTHVAGLIQGHANVTTCTGAILENRKVKLTGSGSFDVTWTDTNVRDMLGFTGNLSGASSYTATNISPLFWSPLRTESPQLAPLGVDGVGVHDTHWAQSATTVITATTNNSWRENSFSWRYVAISRMWTSSEAGGEYYTFYDRVLRRAAPFKLYRNVEEDTSGGDAATLATVLGPYKMKPQGGDTKLKYRREFQNQDLRSPVELDCVKVTEISNS